jgi:SNF2 family DNA or RNA helicase
MSYGRIVVERLERGLYSIIPGYFSRALTDACKTVPGMRFDRQLGKNGGWYGYADAIECAREELAKKGVTLDGATHAPDSWKNGLLTIPVATTGRGDLKTRPYQNEGIKFLVSRATEGCLLADSMRLGKSSQATIAARAFKEKTLVVCPPQVAGVWGRPPDHIRPGEIAKWWPDAWRGLDDKPYSSAKADRKAPKGVVVLEGVEPDKWQTKFRKLSEIKEEKRTPAQAKELKEANAILEDFGKELQNALVVIAHSAIVYAWEEILIRWGLRTLICDEAHDYASFDTRRSIAVKALASVAIRRLALSGTPMLNRPRDLHNVIDIICPGRFGVFFREEGSSYARLFCNSHQKTVGNGPEAKTVWDHNGKSNLDLLKRRLSYLMFRRVAKEVDSQLPAKQRQIVDVKITASKMVMPTMEILKNKAHLRRVLDMAADGKLAQVISIVKGHVEEGTKVLVFCHRQHFAEAVVDGLTDFQDGCGLTFVHGGVGRKESDKRIEQAFAHQGAFVFACTIESCSTGIDLSFADVVIFAELTYEPAELSQAEARTYVVDSGRKQFYQYIIARGTGDELILQSVISKLDDFETVVGTTGDNMKTDLERKRSREDALKALGQALMKMSKKEAEAEA